MHVDTTKILNEEARNFLGALHHRFDSERLELLKQRQVVQAALNKGLRPSFNAATASIRQDPSWKAASIPKELERRWVEITGPVERKMMINALNSGADVFMADFEDALSPTWKNVIEGQKNLIEAVQGTLNFKSAEGKSYSLNERHATLMVRPRGLHLDEKHHLIDGEPIAGAFFDFGLYLFHNASLLSKQNKGPYFYLPKLENSLEARLWNDVFQFSENYLQLTKGSIKATILIETILAAFEMEEILYELREYAIGLNAGRWDYIFSIIKKFAFQPEFLLPDRQEITMEVPFMCAYAAMLVNVCHKRGAHAIGGMAAFVPSRKDPEVNKVALEKVRSDKIREVKEGFDGTWVAHPDLVAVAREEFKTKLNGRLHQKNTHKIDEKREISTLLDFAIEGSKISLEGILQNIKVVLQYLESWLRGVGAVAINHLMEDAATAEIARAQLWQWIHHRGVVQSEGRVIDLDFVLELMQSAYQELKGLEGAQNETLKRAYDLLKELVTREAFTEFLTIEAYQYLPDEN